MRQSVGCLIHETLSAYDRPGAKDRVFQGISNDGNLIQIVGLGNGKNLFKKASVNRVNSSC